MKNLIVSVILCLVFALNAGDKKNWEKQRLVENKKKAEKYRKYAAENKNCELKKYYEEAGGDLLAAAKEVVRLKKKLGANLEKLAKAFEKDEQESIKKLSDEKWELERAVDLAEKKRRATQYISEAAQMARKFPAAAAIKKLKKQIKDSSDLYLKLSEQIVEMEREKIQIEKEIRDFNQQLHKIAGEEREKKRKEEVKLNKKR